ncbi:hypothetical protein Fmac_006781 [Flemingia macrophylla]|uniref:Uncharacterized protein n=1 Tax=Flemingia macrophylla TaxID=520843 RepID=A0ABD1NC45_9FABA
MNGRLIKAQGLDKKCGSTTSVGTANLRMAGHLRERILGIVGPSGSLMMACHMHPLSARWSIPIR